MLLLRMVAILGLRGRTCYVLAASYHERALLVNFAMRSLFVWAAAAVADSA